MAGPTEAECLLKTGALYSERVLLRPPAGEGGPVFLGLKPGAFSAYHGDAPVYHFDLEGRWQRAFVGGLHYLKGLDASVQSIDRVREGKNLVLKRRTLSPAETDGLDARVRSDALGLVAAIADGRYDRRDPPTGVRAFDPGPLLDRAVSWDATAWDRQRSRFRETYGPYPFIPPDSTNPVLLQATTVAGPAGVFGARPAPDSAAPPADGFARHADRVAGLLGALVAQAKVVFLGGSDALRRPAPEILADLRAAANAFRIDPEASRGRPTRARDEPHALAGVHAFLDRLDPPLPSPGDWRALRDAGLVRVILGVESGDAAIRERYGKAWGDDRFGATVAGLKAAGIGVGVVLAVGAGGRSRGGRHVEASSALVNGCGLGPGDLVSLIDVSELEARAGVSRPTGVEPLDRSEAEAQTAAIRERLAPTRLGKRAKVVPYRLDKQGLN